MIIRDDRRDWVAPPKFLECRRFVRLVKTQPSAGRAWYAPRALVLFAIVLFVDPLLESSIALAAAKSPAEKLAEALELMDWGIRLHRDRLRARHPSATDEEIEHMLAAWISRHD